MRLRDSQVDRAQQSGSGRQGAALLILMLVMASGSAGFLVWQTFTDRPIHFAGITIDRLSAALTLLVAAVGSVTFRFSQRYLQGEPGYDRFLYWLSFTVVLAYLLMLSTNLLLLIAVWSLTSLGLHQLLTFYRDRPEARRPARKKFLISRIGDMALLAAVVIIWQNWGTVDLHRFLDHIATSEGDATVTVVGVLIVVAALTKSAQFPFHSWLPETMEAPTPVSALMHAGVINAGGALLLRFAPLIARVPEALLLLVIVGTLTATVGMLAMWAQAKVKRTLAWSTVSQMGFMMVQVGLGAFPAALLHILGHGFYKAWSFLRSGEVPAPVRAMPLRSPAFLLMLVALGVAASVPAMVLATEVTGFSPLHSPGELALSAILALSVGQFWVAVLGLTRSGRIGTLIRVSGVILATLVGVIVVFALYSGASAFLQPVLGDSSISQNRLGQVASALPAVSAIFLTVIHAFLPVLGQTRGGRAFYVHALHGFYFGAIADRFVDALWSCFVPPAKEIARG